MEQKQKSIKGLLIAVSIVCILSSLICFFTPAMLESPIREADRVHVNGLITNVEEYDESDNTRSRLYIRYTADGVEHNTTISRPYSPSYREGGSFAFFYDRNDPQRIGVEKTRAEVTTARVICYTIGVFILGFGCFLPFIPRLIKNKRGA